MVVEHDCHSSVRLKMLLVDAQSIEWIASGFGFA